MKIQILENESFEKYADFENCEVWLLNRTNDKELNENIINISEITESLEPSAVKFPKLFTEISNKYFPEGVIPNDFEYSSEKYAVHSYVCDVDKIIVN